MTIFIVRRCAVYFHELGGAFSSLELATDAALRLMLGEPDKHHTYHIIAAELDRQLGDGKRTTDGGFDDGPILRQLEWVEPRLRFSQQNGPFVREDIAIRDVT